jgi:acyl-CoA thioesterase
MDNMQKIFQRDKFARHNGIELLEAKKGSAKAKMEIKEHHLNGVGTVHGGAIFTLADLAFAMAANSYQRVTVAINVNISYITAVSSGTLFAEAVEISRNPKLATYTINICNEHQDLVAVFQGLAYIKKNKISSLM